jgi:ParB-like chromosome segregation protein Spo0J
VLGTKPPVYAVEVRRRAGGGYEIVGGTTRWTAAKEAGLTQIWAWLCEYTDAEALLRLGLANRQGELTPLEIGVHARSIEPARGHAGAGLAAHATQMGIKPQQLSRYRNGAEVYEVARSKYEFGSRVRALGEHFAAIHRLPRDQWAEFALHCAEGKWTVKETAKRVAAALAPPAGSVEEGTIPTPRDIAATSDSVSVRAAPSPDPLADGDADTTIVKRRMMGELSSGTTIQLDEPPVAEAPGTLAMSFQRVMQRTPNVHVNRRRRVVEEMVKTLRADEEGAAYVEATLGRLPKGAGGNALRAEIESHREAGAPTDLAWGREVEAKLVALLAEVATPKTRAAKARAKKKPQTQKGNPSSKAKNTAKPSPKKGPGRSTPAREDIRSNRRDRR